MDDAESPSDEWIIWVFFDCDIDCISSPGADDSDAIFKDDDGHELGKT
jgi:hypothetical protein